MYFEIVFSHNTALQMKKNAGSLYLQALSLLTGPYWDIIHRIEIL